VLVGLYSDWAEGASAKHGASTTWVGMLSTAYLTGPFLGGCLRDLAGFLLFV